MTYVAEVLKILNISCRIVGNWKGKEKGTLWKRVKVRIGKNGWGIFCGEQKIWEG